MKTPESSNIQWLLVGCSVGLLFILLRVLASIVGLRRRKMGCGALIDDETGRYVCGGRWVIRVKGPDDESATGEKCLSCKNIRTKKKGLIQR